MRQCGWMEFLEDYDFTLHYHHSKENVVVDALSRKSRGVLANVDSWEWQMLETVGQFRLQYSEQAQGTLWSLVATPSLLRRVIESPGAIELMTCQTTRHDIARARDRGSGRRPRLVRRAVATKVLCRDRDSLSI